MKDKDSAKEQLINELAELRQRVAELEAADTERKRAEEAIRQHTAQLEALRQVGLEITAQLSLETLLQSIASRAVELLEGASGGLDLYQPDGDVLKWTAAVGSNMAPLGTVLHRGEGLSGKVWETGEPLIVDDYQHWKGRAPSWEGVPITAIVGVPVRWGEEFLGSLIVHADPPRTFSPADAELLSLFATQAAIAIRNARLYKETRQRALEQETVSRIAYALNTPDVRDAFPVLAEELQDLTDCEMVNLMVMDETGEQFIISVLESPFPIPGEGDVMPLSDTAALESLEAGRPHLLADLSAETCFPLEEALYQAGLRSQVTLPLLIGGEVFGALNLGSSRTGLFREDQLPVLRQIADAVALALENSLLFLAEQERRELAEALDEAAAVVNSTLDPDQVLDRILEQVSRVVPNDAVNIMLIEGDQARIVRWRGYERFGAEEFVSTVVFHIPDVPNLQQMIKSREPMVISDTATYPGWVDVPVQEWLRSYAAAPIVVRGEVIGFLNVDSATPDFFTPDHAETLRAFATHAAAAIENARLYESERKRRAELEALRQASLHLTSTLELQPTLEAILDHALQLVTAYDAHIFLYDGQRLAFGAALWEDGRQQEPYAEPRPQGLTYTVARSGERIVIPDVNSHPLFQDYQWGGAIVGLPLCIGERVVGVMNVAFQKPHDFAESELRVLGLLADQAAIAIENARLYEEERRRATQLALINEVGEKAASILDLDKLMQEVTRSIQESFNYYNVAFFLLDEERREVVMRAVAGGFEHVAPGEYRQSLDQGIIGFAARTGQSHLAKDVSQDPHYVEGFLREVLTKSELCLPIKLGDKVIGALDVQSIRLDNFKQADVVALETVADRVAIAMEKARLYDETKQWAEEMTALHKIGLVTTSTLDLDEVLKLIYEKVSQLMQTDSFYIGLYDEQKEEINFEIFVEKGQNLGKFSIELEEGGLTNWIIQSNQPLLIRNTAEKDLPIEPRVKGARTAEMSYLGLPLLVKGKVIGVISVQSFRPYVFDEGDQRFLTAIANQAAIAIENARLFEETERLKTFNESVVQGIAEAILIEDDQGILTFANPAAEELLGYTSEELIGQRWTTIVPDEQTEKVQKELVKRPQRVQSRYETALLSKEGQVIPVIVSARPLFEDGEFTGVLSAFTDITERKQAEEKLAHMATHDSLTGLPNRRGFFTLAEQQLRVADRAKSGMLLLFTDLDDLKRINDALGHQEGDQALIEVADVLRETFREADIMARIGGDEFVVLAVETDGASAETLTARLRENLETRNAEGDLDYKLSLSGGLARYDPENPCSIDELLARADRAMYEQKGGER